jgi:hypothetical protein
MFTLAPPKVRAISATVPGRFSIEIVNCLVLAMLAPPMACWVGIIRLAVARWVPTLPRSSIFLSEMRTERRR